MKRWYFFVAREIGSDHYVNGTIRARPSKDIPAEIVKMVWEQRGINAFVQSISRL